MVNFMKLSTTNTLGRKLMERNNAKRIEKATSK